MGSRGPPPGLSSLGAFHLLAASSSSEPSSQTPSSCPLSEADVASTVDASIAKTHVLRGSQAKICYSVGTLLALSTSKLVCKPEKLPALKAWYGEEDAKAYRAKAHSVSQGPDLERNNGNRRGDGARESHRRRDQQPIEDEEGHSYGRYDSRKNVTSSGKNPFGQISASGTFRPAGGPDSPSEKQFRMGSERIMPSNRGRIGLGVNDQQRRDPVTGRRIPGAGIDEGDDEDSGAGDALDRRSNNVGVRSGYADTAADWRRPGQASALRDGMRYARDGGGVGGNTRDRNEGSERRRAPAWMEEIRGASSSRQPAWMGGDDDDEQPLSRRAPQRRDRQTREEEVFDLPPVTGNHVDSIQAFKAQMKEKERLEREAKAGAKKATRPPPGLGAPADLATSAVPTSLLSPTKSASPLATKEQGDDSFGATAAAASSSPASPSRARNAPPPGLGGSSANETSAANPITEGAPQLQLQQQGGRSSRFARFFDSKARDPQSAALVAQQKAMEGAAAGAGGGASGATNSSSTNGQLAAGAGAGVDLSSLFGGASLSGGGDATESVALKQESQAQSAEQASMQKLLAMLQSGIAPSALSPGEQQQQQARPEPHDQVRHMVPSPMMSQSEMGGTGGPPRSADLQVLLGGGQPPQRSPPHAHLGQRSSHIVGQLQQQDGHAAHLHQHQHMSLSGVPPPGSSPPRPFAGHPGMAPGMPPLPPFMTGPPSQQQQQQVRLPPAFAALPSAGMPTSPVAPPELHGHPEAQGSAAGERSSSRGGNGVGGGGLPPLVGLPPHLQQQLYGLPPYVQHQVLSAQQQQLQQQQRVGPSGLPLHESARHIGGGERRSAGSQPQQQTSSDSNNALPPSLSPILAQLREQSPGAAQGGQQRAGTMQPLPPGFTHQHHLPPHHHQHGGGGGHPGLPLGLSPGSQGIGGGGGTGDGVGSSSVGAPASLYLQAMLQQQYGGAGYRGGSGDAPSHQQQQVPYQAYEHGMQHQHHQQRMAPPPLGMDLPPGMTGANIMALLKGGGGGEGEGMGGAQ
ncbi:hypothetical protein K437DRAFT_259449 [Tilletiaria anomala UBC 951]|uniref:Uncharacterized protein n=1 Tax=Tilletiaria anomala (strain ATCC 24038 / CBS 436.72 / UBC 951) TaxID=1037660 RepID=A0A066VID0_TILAU|nr:uncharacterized protein K437DRAFT_259449 [Tilletiaria anomala UBC 951]KDN38325.1 hypothetical protein K437DRAFT_259449 [Tilletiaria anomala UBC 951]